MPESALRREPTPARIVEPGGRVHVGWFDRPFVEANLQDLPRGLWRRSWSKLRLKQWHYSSVASPELFFACAVVDVGYVGNAFAYLVDRKTGRCFEWSTLSPLAMGIRIAHNSIDGRTSIVKPGWGHILFANDGAAGKRVIDVRLLGRLGSRPAPTLTAQIDIVDRGREPDPVIVVEESEPGCYLYTHKCYGLAATGRVRCGDIDVHLDDGHAGLDYNRGFRPRETWWNWAAGGGFSADGARLGFNLTAHRPWAGSGHESQHSAPDAADCALWLDGRCIKLRRVQFDYDPAELMHPWQIRDDEGLVDLRFTPIGDRRENVDFGIIVSRFHQPYGTFEGELRDREGQRFAVRDLFGVTEQHFARW